MMEYQLRSMGFNVRLAHYTSPLQLNSHELLVIGPGPGDPRDLGDERVARSRKLILDAIQREQPFIAICFWSSDPMCSTGISDRRARFAPIKGYKKKSPSLTKLKESVFTTRSQGWLPVMRWPVSMARSASHEMKLLAKFMVFADHIFHPCNFIPNLY
ncbi:Uncharacterised protein [Serratia fonticola]|uniref:Uncharacterized protein n=1 Tax=Serratia fonticola TaxID=47917 RepID=A0A4U9WIR8_SERFO|nr:Uncharacterised protein [Serratia fonticola]